MSLHKYVSVAYGLVEEIESLLSEKDYEDVQVFLEKDGGQAWEEWRAAHQKDIEAFLRATPAKRQKTKKWNTKEARHLFAAAALLQARKGRKMLEAAMDAEQLEGLSYRDALGEAAEIADRLFYSS